MKIFESRRNRVSLQNRLVHKRHSDPQGLATESEMLALLYNAGVRVPQVDDCIGHVIRMEYIKGLTLCEYLLADDLPIPPTRAADAIAAWLEDFYAAVDHSGTGVCRGDVSGGNFILHKELCWGVDFEERCLGTKERDAGRLLAFVETFEIPDRIRQRKFYNDLYTALNSRFALDDNLVNAERLSEIAEIGKRR